MKRITEYEESLNIVRAKCESKNTDFTKEEVKHLSLANIELQKSYGKKFVKPLDNSCSYCVITAMNCIHNYIMFEEPIEKAKESVSKTIIPVTHMEVEGEIQPLPDGGFTEIIEVPEEPDGYNEDYLRSLGLKVLRERFPNIKARSIDKFIQLLKAE